MEECCGNCTNLYREYGYKLCMVHEVPMDDIHNEKCEDYERRADEGR